MLIFKRQHEKTTKTARGLQPPHIVLGSDSAPTQTFLLRQLDYFLCRKEPAAGNGDPTIPGTK